MLEVAEDEFDRARRCFQEGVRRCGGAGGGSGSGNGNTREGGKDASMVQVLQAWACLELRAGDTEAARRTVRRAIEVDRSHGPCWAAYAVIEERGGDLGEARRVVAEGLARAPLHGPLYRTAAELEARAGNYDAARQLFQQVSTLLRK
jgi:Tfp pilus assembly protein PilF